MSTTETSERLASIRARIDEACRRCGRSAAEVTLIAVSKKHPAESIRSVLDAGHRVFGESQVQEAERKAAALAGVEWHLIGPLQSNKARRAARVFDVVHSVDRLKVARLLNKEAAALGRRIDVFLQLNLGEEQTKHGFSPRELEEVVAAVVGLSSLRLVGLMCIPPIEPEREGARKWFSELRGHGERVKKNWPSFPGALSMGMSRDFDIAIEEGATHVRVGTELFGARPT